GPTPQPAAFKLLVGHPLHEFDEADTRFLTLTQTSERLRIPSSPLPRPFPPRTSKFAAQEFEAGKSQQQVGAAGAKLIEGGASLRRRGCEKCRMCAFQRARLEGVDCAIVQGRIGSEPANPLLHPRRAQPGKFRYGFDVDVKR